MLAQNSADLEKLLSAQCCCAAEVGALAGFDQLRHAAHVVVVPVRGDDQADSFSHVNVDALQVSQCARRSLDIDARVDDRPDAIACMKDDALSVSRAEKRKLELASFRRRSGNCHGLSDRAMFCAQASLSAKSLLVTTGRSRNTICDTRFFVPAGDRS